MSHFGADLMGLFAAMEAAGVYARLLQQLVDQAAAEGFAPRRQSSVRIDNLALLCQSAGSVGYAPLSARAAGATILLATAPNALDQYRYYQVASVETWPRPLMILTGEVDGQMRWPWLSSYIAECAVQAAKFGPGYAATHRPVVVLPGVNHGNTSNGEARVARGDITAGVMDYDKCMQALGGHVAAFLVAHFAAAEDARAEASAFLLQRVQQSMLLTAPYCAALGLGDTAAPFRAAPGGQASQHPPAGPPCLPGGVVAGAQRVAASALSSALPPGLVVAAEEWAVELQRRVLAGLPAAARERLTIAATAHTDVETLLYSQPEMLPLGDDRWLLRVHVLLHFRALDGIAAVPFQHLTSKAPDYALKLKDATVVAATLGLPSPSQYVSPKPAELNSLALERALAAAPPEVVERYRRLGRRMDFGDDCDFFVPGPDGKLPPSPEGFVRDARISFKHLTPSNTLAASTSGPAASTAAASDPPSSDSPGGLVRVSSPYFVVPVSGDVPVPPSRFMGPYYAKVISVAQAMEWVWLDCLRGIDTPW